MTIFRPTTTSDSATLTVPTTVSAANSNSATIDTITNASRVNRLDTERSGNKRCRCPKISRVPPPANKIIMPRNSQPIGDWLNAWRLLNTPLRVKNVAKLQPPNVAIVNARLVFFSMPPACHAISA